MENFEKKLTQSELTKHPEVVEMRENIMKRARLLSDDNKALIQEVLEAGWNPERVRGVVAELKEYGKEIEDAKRYFLEAA